MSKAEPAAGTVAQKVGRLKTELGIKATATIAESTAAIAKELGVSSEGKVLAVVVDECYTCLFGSTSAGPSSRKFPSVSCTAKKTTAVWPTAAKQSRWPQPPSSARWTNAT